jgi:hypothetical protein
MIVQQTSESVSEPVPPVLSVDVPTDLGERHSILCVLNY